jgi:flagellar FliL protein
MADKERPATDESPKAKGKGSPTVDKAKPATDDPPKPKAKGGRLKFLAIGGVLLLAVAGASWWFFLRPAPGEQSPAKVEAPPEKPKGGGVVTLEPFLVNLADKEGARFLRVSMRLIVPEAKEAEEIAKDEVRRVRLRAGILELLATQTAQPLLTPEGKNALRTAIIKESAAILEPCHVIDVLFTDFVVQL